MGNKVAPKMLTYLLKIENCNQQEYWNWCISMYNYIL